MGIFTGPDWQVAHNTQPPAWPGTGLGCHTCRANQPMLRQPTGAQAQKWHLFPGPFAENLLCTGHWEEHISNVRHRLYPQFIENWGDKIKLEKLNSSARNIIYVTYMGCDAQSKQHFWTGFPTRWSASYLCVSCERSWKHKEEKKSYACQIHIVTILVMSSKISFSVHIYGDTYICTYAHFIT